MASKFRYPFDIQSTLEPWRHQMGSQFDDVVAHLSDRDRAIEDYITRGCIQIATSTTRPVAPTPGQLIYETDTLLVMVWTGTEWRRVAPAGIAWSRLSMNPASTTSGTYVDVPGWIDLNFTKRSASTQLYITLHASAFVSAASAVDFGIRINGTDIDVCHHFFNVGNTHMAFSAAIGGFDGLAAGNYAARLRWRNTSGGPSVSIDGNDLFSLRIEEELGM